MKGRSILVFTLVFALLTIGCQNPITRYKQLQRENDSLKNVLRQSDFTLQQYLTAFNEIQQNLNEIKQKENIITLTTKGAEGELSENAKDQVIDDIQTIYKLMEENKAKLKQLKRQLARTRNKNRELLKTIQLYEQQLQMKDQEIASLKKRLEELNINIEQLNQQVAQLKENVDTLQKIKQQQEVTIQQQDVALHTAYYVVGSKKELMQHGVVDRKGFLAKLEITGDFDKNYFTKIDTRETTHIPVMAKKIEIMTKHPSGSYQLVKEDNIVKELVITDPDRFWETSKFLVIMVK